MSTKTSTFGSNKRESHDSSMFYDRFDKVIEDKTDVRGLVSPANIDMIYNHSSESMVELPDSCVSLMVTSPPYHVGKDYDTDTSFDDYLDLLHTVLKESYRVLHTGGRAAINLANLGRRPYIPLTSFVDALCLDVGFFPRGQLIWIKADGAGGSTAFGSYKSASNPVIRDVHEYVLLYSKGNYGRLDKGESNLTKEEFLSYTQSVWRINPESAKRIGHPAPYPAELPRRLIKLYTYRNDLVLDPFMGSGTTAVVAKEQHRHYVGYETDPLYVDLAETRLA